MNNRSIGLDGPPGPMGPQGASFIPVSSDVNMNSYSLTSLSNINSRAANSLVVGPVSVVTSRLASYASAVGNVIQDSGYVATDFMVVTPNLINVGVNQTMAVTNKINVRGVANDASVGPHVSYYVSGDQYPVFQNLNFNHDSIFLSFDAYFDGVWKSSHLGSNFRISKLGNQLLFEYGASVALGGALTWTTAGYITNAGILQWNKQVKTTDSFVCGNTVANRKMVLYDIGNDHQFYGFGVNGSTLRYQVDNTVSNHIFYAGVSSVSSIELARITGSGGLTLAGTTASVSTLTGTLIVPGGVGVGGSLFSNTVESTIGMKARSQYVNGTKFVNTVDVIVTNTIVQTTLCSGTGSLTYAANTTNIGMVIRVKLGINVTSYAGLGSLDITGYVGGVQVYIGSWPTATSSQAVISIDLCPRASGTLRCVGAISFQSGTDQLYQTTTSSWTLTNANTLDFRAQWSTASAANSLTAMILSVESMNQA